jgi:hypothetical protein
MKRFTILVLAVVLGGWVAAQDLPVTRVVLFTSGVGYFEHRGPVTGDAQVPLTFTEDQVNDVLKSLIPRDPNGTVGVVGYPSQDPLERSLRSFALDLGGPGGLESLLPQLRGVPLTLSTPTDLTGKLVGLDKRTTAEKTETWLTLATDTGLKTVPLSSITGVKILDAKVDRELSQALALVAGSRDARQKTVSVQFKGTGTRTVSLGYIAEAPVWKTSYRLDLSGAKPFLQAWAIVENTSEVDWNQVRLSLVSGRPVSFIQDLYTPLYIDRPVYIPANEAGPAPRINAASAPPAPAPMAMKSAAPALEASRDFMAEDSESVVLRDSGVRAAASGGTAGELFQFTLQSPVSLARHRSALIPLAAAELEAQKVSLYNPSVDSVHPQNAVWVTNTTGLRLPAGPVTVYDGGMYAGDALTDSLVEKDKRLWTYATDLTVRGDVTSSGDQSVTKITVVKGVLNYKKELNWTTTYRFSNLGTESRTVVVEHPYRQERTLTTPGAEKAGDLWRFTIEAPAAAQSTLAVNESQTVVETQGLAGWRSEQIVALVGGPGPLSPAAKAALQRIVDLKGQVDRAVGAVADLERRKTELESDQARTRNNLAAVGRDSTQGQTYLKRLSDSDVQIDAVTQGLTPARKSLSDAQRTLDDGIRNLSVE